MAVVVLMSIGDCFIPVAHTPSQLSGPKEELEGPYDVKCANRLCGVSFIASVPLQGRDESLTKGEGGISWKMKPEDVRHNLV